MASFASAPRCMAGQFASTTQPSTSSMSGFMGQRATLAHACAQHACARRGRGAALRVRAMKADDSRCSNMEKSLFGEDFGARDPFAGELATNFTDKVLGYANTEHIVKPPDTIAQIIGLKAKSCTPVEADAQPLGDADIERLKQQVPGWKLSTDYEGVKCIRQDWKVKDAESGVQLLERINAVAQAEGHKPTRMEVEGDSVYATLCTHAVGGLSENDFILAAKINELEITDLQPKKRARFWA